MPSGTEAPCTILHRFTAFSVHCHSRHARKSGTKGLWKAGKRGDKCVEEGEKGRGSGAGRQGGGEAGEAVDGPTPVTPAKAGVHELVAEATARLMSSPHPLTPSPPCGEGELQGNWLRPAPLPRFPAERHSIRLATRVTAGWRADPE